MAQDSKPTKKFSLSKLARPRWNVLDLMNQVGRGSIPTYMTMDIDMTWAEDLRVQLSRLGHKTTVTAILLKAIAIAQRNHPDTRTAVLPWGKTVTFNEIVAGFTVERFVGTQPALFFGAIQQADTKSVEEIALELREHAEKDFADVWQLRVQDKFTHLPRFIRNVILWVGLRFPAIRLACMNATFGVSSLGKFGVKILVPPCVTTSTFGVGAVEQRPVVVDGTIQIRRMMTLTLNFDHRLIDGAPAARFLSDIKSLLEGGLEKYLSDELKASYQTLASNLQELSKVSTGPVPVEVN